MNFHPFDNRKVPGSFGLRDTKQSDLREREKKERERERERESTVPWNKRRVEKKPTPYWRLFGVSRIYKHHIKP